MVQLLSFCIRDLLRRILKLSSPVNFTEVISFFSGICGCERQCGTLQKFSNVLIAVDLPNKLKLIDSEQCLIHAYRDNFLQKDLNIKISYNISKDISIIK